MAEVTGILQSILTNPLTGIIYSRNGSYIPSFTDSFTSVIANYGLIYDFEFGTSRLPDVSVNNVFTSIAPVSVYFQPYSNNAGTITINREWQRYQPLNTASNFVFTSDSLDLTATIDETTLPAKTSLSPSSNVTYSRTVPFSSTASVTVGQVVGLGAEQYANIHATQTYSISSTVSTGTAFTVSVSARDTAWTPVGITITASAADTNNTVAAAIVSTINANSTLQTNQVTAYLMPESPGCYGITYPKKTLAAVSAYGNTGAGSLRPINISVTAAGGLGTHANVQTIFNTYVVSVSAAAATLNHPITASTGTPITFSPSRMLSVENTILSKAIVSIGTGLHGGISEGQLVQLSFQDTNLRRVTNVASKAITLEASVFCNAGLLITTLPAYAALVSGTTSATNVIPLVSVPSGVTIGQTVANYFAGVFSSVANYVTSVGVSTIQVSDAINVANGDRIYFSPKINSAQLWSKFIMAPNMDDRNVIAGELECDIPDAADIGGWPAFWSFTDTADPNPTPSGSGTSESDFMDNFIYWNNNSTNNFIGTNSGSTTDLYTHPDWSSGSLAGNNAGSIAPRKIQFVLTPNRAYYYLDGLLIRATTFSWNTYKRAQFAMNLAIGSGSTSFNSNGFFPIDMSQFPMKFRIKNLKFWADPNFARPLGTPDVPTPFSVSGATFYVDATDPTTITQGAGTSISQWNDLTVSANHATQATGTNQPLYASASAVIFDGVNDTMTVPASAITYGPTTAFWVTTPTATSAAVHALASDGTGGGTNRFFLANQSVDFGNTTLTRTSIATSAVVIQCATVLGTGTTTQRLKVNDDEEIQSAVTRSGKGTNFRLGSYGNGTANFFKGPIKMEAVYNRALSDTEKNLIGSALATKYSGTWSNIETPTFVSRTNLPDASGGDTGKGFTCTGLAFDASANCFWVGNHGLNVVGDTSYQSSIVKISKDGSTKLDEIILDPIFPGIQSVQGVTLDTTNDSLWFASIDENLVRNISKSGTSLGSFAFTAPNGLAYDSLTDTLLIMDVTNNNIKRYSKVGVSLSTFNIPALSDRDALFFDAGNNAVWYSAGANFSDGTIRGYNLSSGNITSPKTLSGADAIEGFYMDGSKIYVANDGYFHGTPTSVNALLVYNFTTRRF